MATGVSYKEGEDDYIYYYDNEDDDINWEDELSYELDAHWQSESPDYGRMSVRRFSQELVTSQSLLAQRPSFDLSSLVEFDLDPTLGDPGEMMFTSTTSQLLRRGSVDVLARHNRRPSDEALRQSIANRRFSLGVILDAPERRGGISFEKTDKNAMYVRMLGDVKVQTKPVISRERRRSSILDSDFRILENLDVTQHKIRCSHKFLSLRRRHRPRPRLHVSSDNASILDDHYSGQAKCLLSTIGDWQFNVFNLDKLTNGRALFHISLHMFQQYRLIETFQLDIVKLMRCFTLIEEGYHGNNPYHNAVHAADVGQAMHCYLQEPKLAKCVTPLETMIALVAAFTHDLDHPGVNQAFLISTSNHLATLYKNSSVLENHHWRSAMGIIHESGVFSHLDPTAFATIEHQVRSLILATDITRQQEFLNRCKRQLDTGELNMELEDHRHFMLQIALKCADICNPCRPWDVSKRWSEQVCDEFFQQGDCERQLQLSVTPNCDRYKTTVAKIQSGFIQFVVSPLFAEWYRFNPSTLSKTMMNNMQQNRASWDVIIAETEASVTGAVGAGREAGGSSTCSSDEDSQDMVEGGKENFNINVNVHCEDVPEECILEGRFDCPGGSYHPAPLTDGGGYVTKDVGGRRRHSLPPQIINRDIMQLVAPRRGSFPKLKMPPLSGNGTTLNCRGASRRHSLPISMTAHHNPALLDKLAVKLASLTDAAAGPLKDNGLDPSALNSRDARPLSSRSRITSLSPDSETTRVLNSLDVLLAARAAGNSGTLLVGRLPTRLRHAPPKEVTFDLQDCSGHMFHGKSVPYSNSSKGGSHQGALSSRAGGTNGNGARQVLRPIDTNSQGAKDGGVPRRRSGSEEFANFPLRSQRLRGILYERPRSLSLEIESQPLLRSIGEWRMFSGEADHTEHMESVRDRRDDYPGGPAAGAEVPEGGAGPEGEVYPDPADGLTAAVAATGHEDELTSLTTPLLCEHRTLTRPDPAHLTET